MTAVCFPLSEDNLFCYVQPAIFMALNAILKVVDVSISRAKNAKPEDEWSVSDGRSLTRYRDGMVSSTTASIPTHDRVPEPWAA